MEATNQVSDAPHILNVGGTVFEIPGSILDQHPESVFEAIFSGRQHLE